jgi:cytoskeletal protein CcmA (bactofilin family)
MDAEKATIIDAAAQVEGKLTGKDARILGTFKGEITLTGRLQLGEGCQVEATIKADQVEIAGQFKGEVTTRSLLLLEKARVSATLSAQSLAVREGAQLDGAVNAGRESKGAAAAAPSTGTALAQVPPKTEA